MSAINIGEIGRSDEHKIIASAAAHDIVRADIIEEITARIASKVVGGGGAGIIDVARIFGAGPAAINDIGRALIGIVAMRARRADAA